METESTELVLFVPYLEIVELSLGTYCRPDDGTEEDRVLFTLKLSETVKKKLHLTSNFITVHLENLWYSAASLAMVHEKVEASDDFELYWDVDAGRLRIGARTK